MPILGTSEDIQVKSHSGAIAVGDISRDRIIYEPIAEPIRMRSRTNAPYARMQR